MKELTIEEKAKAYDEAKLRMSAAYNSNRCTIGFMNEIFPELKESEDEKVRKVLISQYQGDGCIRTNEYRIDYKDIRAWLEKQGEHANFRNKIQIGDKVTRNEDGVLVNLSQLKRVAKPVEPMIVGQEPLYDYTNANICQKDFAEQKPADKVEPKFKAGDHIKPIDKCLGSPRIIEKVYDGWYVTDKGTLYFEFEDNWELVEKNPAWSEEDEQYIIDTLNLLSFGCSIHSISEVQDFLLSLKNRYTWKPSDEQMERLKGAINSLPHQEVLYSLYQDLKKLRGSSHGKS